MLVQVLFDPNSTNKYWPSHGRLYTYNAPVGTRVGEKLLIDGLHGHDKVVVVKKIGSDWTGPVKAAHAVRVPKCRCCCECDR